MSKKHIGLCFVALFTAAFVSFSPVLIKAATKSDGTQLKWEYRVLEAKGSSLHSSSDKTDIKIDNRKSLGYLSFYQDHFNSIGNEGWEMVSTDGRFFMFKRQVK